MVRRLPACTAAAGLVAVLSPLTAPAQSLPITRLERPDAEFPDPFTVVSGVRELSDGRVIVSDGQERKLLLVDFSARSARPVAREGAGPGEFAVPRRLWALRGDSTLLHDPGNGRYLLLLPNAEPGPTISLEEVPVSGVSSVRGVDALGRFYLQLRSPRAAARSAGNNGEETLVRLDRLTGRVDTLARLQLPEGREQGSQSLGGGMLRLLDNRPLAAEDVAAIGADGRVAIVRVADYHVEWIDAQDRRTVGTPVRYDPIRVTDAEKNAALDAMIVPGQIITRVQPGAEAVPLPPVRGGASARGGARPLPPGFDEASMVWPVNKPPFLANAASVTPEGQLWVLRTRRHTDATPTYDVFDSAGRLTSRIALPTRARLVGFGRGTVYLIRSDQDDLQYLQRYRR